MKSAETTSIDQSIRHAEDYRIRPRFAVPVLAAAAGLIAGIGFDFLTEPPAWSYGLVFAGAMIAWIAARRVGRQEKAGPWKRLLPGVTLALAFSTGGIRHAASFRWIDENHIVRFTDSQPVAARVRGVVCSKARVRRRPTHVFANWMPHVPTSSFLLDVTAVELRPGWAPVTGRLRVSVKERFEAARPGQHVEIYGRLFRFGPPQNPGQFDWGLFQRRNGVWAGLSVDHGQAVRVLASDEAGAIRTFRTWIRRQLAALLLDDIEESSQTSGLLRTMVLGQRDAVDRAMNDAFVRTGTAHFLAVSGLHVGMITTLVMLIGRLLRLSRRDATVLSSCVIAAYVLAADPRAPILRAAVMGGFLLVAILSRRPTRSSPWLAMAAVILLLVRPTWLFSPSFQLSFVVVASVAYLTPAVARSFDAAVRRFQGYVPADHELARPIWFRRYRYSEDMSWKRATAVSFGWYVAVCLAAWTAGVPLAAYHFEQVSLLGWASSLVLCVFVFFVMLCSCVKVALNLFLPTAGLWFSGVLGLVTGVVTTLVGWMEKVPGMHLIVGPPPATWVVGAYVLLAGWAWDWKIRGGRRWRGALGAALVVGAAVWYWPTQAARNALTVTCLAVGNGSATLIRLPDGSCIAYDVGTLGGYDVGGNVVVPAARALGIRQVREAIVSHPNIDHFSGLPELGEALGLQKLWLHEHYETLAGQRGAARFLLEHTQEQGIQRGVLVAGQTLTWGKATLDVLWPPADPPFELTDNDSSLVIRLRHEGRSILLCGDIERQAQAALLARGDLHADVLVLPHHGGYVANTPAFVEAVGAKVLIRSTGVRDAHSNAKLVELIRDYDYYSTAEVGAVTVTVSAAGIETRTFAGQPE